MKRSTHMASYAVQKYSHKPDRWESLDKRNLCRKMIYVTSNKIEKQKIS